MYRFDLLITDFKLGCLLYSISNCSSGIYPIVTNLRAIRCTKDLDSKLSRAVSLSEGGASFYVLLKNSELNTSLLKESKSVA
jgi:hypothetical protein